MTETLGVPKGPQVPKENHAEKGQVQSHELHLPMQEVGVQFLVGELRSCMPCSQETKVYNKSSVATNSVKTLKMVHVKKKKRQGMGEIGKTKTMFI